jgi:hypothetical protein
MFPRRLSRRGVLFVACLLAWAATDAFAAITPLSPINTSSATTSLNFSWASSGSNYIAAISTDSKFSVTAASGTLSVNTVSYSGLGQNTTYYFRVKKQAESDAAYIINTATTPTLAAAPLNTYSIPAFFTAVSSFTAYAKIGWDTAGNPDWTRYEISYSKDSGFASESVAPKPNPPVDVGGLDANTTYYFRVRARGLDGTATVYAPPAGISTSTLAESITGLDEEVFETSATVSWNPVYDASIQALTSEGYRLHVSTNSNDLITPATVYWQTGDPTSGSVDLGPLASNTEYSYRIGTLNWGGNSNLRDIRSFSTLAPQPQNPKLLNISSFSATVGWTALPVVSAEGYRLEASSTGFNDTGDLLFEDGFDLSQSTLTITGLDANTTYYFRASSFDQEYDQNYSQSVSSITLTVPPSADLPTITSDMFDITVQITPLPGTPQSNSCEGYLLEGSSTAFDGTGVIYSSATADPFPGSLVLSGLTPNLSYSLRLATLNWDGTPNFSTLSPFMTVLPPSPGGPRLTAIWQSSATVTYSATAGGQSYMIEASSMAFASGVVYSSVTTDVTVTTLSVTGLDENTAYYFRAGATYSGFPVYTNVTPYEKQTLPQTLTLAATPFSGVFYSSATLAWTPLSGASLDTSADSYRLEASTSPNFVTVQFSSSSEGITAAQLTLAGLSPNTSYYFRAASVNLEGGASYAVAPATATMANPPTPQTFGLTPFTMTLNWLVNSNPPDTLYFAELADNPSFSPAVSSGTYNPYATFTGLSANTTYYTRVTAINRLSRPAPTVNFADMATDANDPGYAPFSDIGVSSMTVNWLKGANPQDVTAYSVQISSRQDFSGTVLSSVTFNLSAVFGGMVSNASYYMQVSALNYTGIPSPPVSLGSALTLPATPYMLAPEQAFTAGMTDGFTVNWLDNGNSSATVYNVRVSTDSGFSVINSSLSVKGLSCTFKDLFTDTTYWVEARAQGQSGIYSDYVLAGSTKTLYSSLLDAVAMQDSLITLQTSYGVISVHMPAGSIGSSTRMTLAPLNSPAYTFPAPASAVSALLPTGIGLGITYFPSTLVLSAITITLPYRLSDLPLGTDRDKLVLAYFDENHSVWVPLPSVSDTAHDQVIGQTWHLSTFQLMQATPEATLSGTKIYPNPYRPNSVSDVMHFTNMPPYAKVKIYTFLGELVRELKADVNGMAHWDGMNGNGNEVASGVYIAFIQTADKRSARNFKVAIER